MPSAARVKVVPRVELRLMSIWKLWPPASMSMLDESPVAYVTVVTAGRE